MQWAINKWSQDQTIGDVIPKNQLAVDLNVRHTSQNLNSQYRPTLKIDVVQIRFFQYHNDNVDSKLKNSTQALASQKNCVKALNSRFWSLDLKQRLIKAALACALLTIDELCLSNRSLLSIIIPRSTVSFFEHKNYCRLPYQQYTTDRHYYSFYRHFQYAK